MGIWPTILVGSDSQRYGRITLALSIFPSNIARHLALRLVQSCSLGARVPPSDCRTFQADFGLKADRDLLEKVLERRILPILHPGEDGVISISTSRLTLGFGSRMNGGIHSSDETARCLARFNIRLTRAQLIWRLIPCIVCPLLIQPGGFHESLVESSVC